MFSVNRKVASSGRPANWLAKSLVLLAVSTTSLVAQHAPGGQQRSPGVPASVTSQNFGGHIDHAPGIPASVTGYGTVGAHNNRAPFGVRPLPGPGNSNGTGHHKYQRDQGYIYGFAPYYYGGYDNYGPAPEGTGAEAQDQYNGGPTIFDRRGNGDYNGPAPDNSWSRHEAREDRREDRQETTMASANEPAPPIASSQPETLLVFKDGHKVEVQNYAIVGSTLYDFSEGRRTRISMAELDIPATSKQNDERGVDFTVPNAKSK